MDFGSAGPEQGESFTFAMHCSNNHTTKLFSMPEKITMSLYILCLSKYYMPKIPGYPTASSCIW